jgi:phosphatidylserine decarboxylase
MSSHATAPAQALVPAPINSIQPGGGFCFNLELAWGRLRRRFLRRFRHGYVERMLSVRKGSCSNCPHDIIDPRDLKPYRNVCGYFFDPQDDAFAYRSRLGFARPGLAELLCSCLLFGTLTLASLLATFFVSIYFIAPLISAAVLGGFCISFFRDPQRTIPTAVDVLVSPADGTVTHIDQVEEPDFPGGQALRVSIFLSVFNVHVNRIARTARVTAIQYFPGAFLDARSNESSVRNEQLWVDLEEASGRRLRVKQISGAIARRIVCWLRVGEEVKAGERFGMIKFGSRTEVLVPAEPGITLCVRVGDKVQGGSTVLLRFGTKTADHLA